MKAKAWLILELEETRTSGLSSKRLKITGVRQSQPLDRLALHVTIEIPEEIVMPKAELVAKFEEQVKLLWSDEVEDAATS